MTELERRAQQLLQDVLRLLATDLSPEQCVPPILEMIATIGEAQSAAFALFNEPQVLQVYRLDEALLPPMGDLQAIAKALDGELQISSQLPQRLSTDYSGWLVAPIPMSATPNGILCLFYEGVFDIHEDLLDILVSFVHALTLVVHYARLKAQQEKFSRNQNEFIRIVSHDLRSPLTSIKGFADMLESSMVGDLNEKQAHFVGKILSGIEQMSSFVDNVQDAGRYDPETGFYEMERTPCDLLELIHRIVNNYLVPAEKQELTLLVDAADDVPIINVDQTMLQRAIVNLVDNAIKYTPNGGTIKVGVHQRGEELIISVSDNGYGISPENQQRLFERHFRIRRQEHKKVKGGGLGLFIVRSVAQRHGGRAWIESEEGRGSTFFISIPLKGANLMGNAEV